MLGRVRPATASLPKPKCLTPAPPLDEADELNEADEVDVRALDEAAFWLWAVLGAAAFLVRFLGEDVSSTWITVRLAEGAPSSPVLFLEEEDDEADEVGWGALDAFLADEAPAAPPAGAGLKNDSMLAVGTAALPASDRREGQRRSLK